MARFYATFDNSTESGLEGNRYERKAFTNGAALKQDILDTRAALSAAIYGQMDAANRNGSIGRVIPANAISLDGTNLSFGNVYTNTAAVWPSDPSVRPTTAITTANSTPVSPTDGGVVSQALYTNATAALGAALAGIAGGGPNGRIGLNAWRTLASLWHDHALTYLAWDDFTPGTPQNFTNANNVVTGNSGTPAQVSMEFGWLKEYEADLLGTIVVSGTITNNAGFTKAFSATVNANLGGTTIVVTDITAGGTFDIIASAQFFDGTIATHGGTPATATFFGAFTVVEA